MGAAARPLSPRLPAALLELLFEILEQVEPVVSGTALADFAAAAGAPLVAAGIVKSHGHEATDSSQEHDDRPLDLVWSAETGAYGYFHPLRGWVTVDADRTKRFRVDIEVVAAALLARFRGPTRSPASWLADRVWELREIRIPHRTRRVSTLLVRRAVDPLAWREIRKLLLSRPAANLRILFSAARSADWPEDVPAGNVFISMREVVSADGSLAVDPDVLAARLDHPVSERVEGPASCHR